MLRHLAQLQDSCEATLATWGPCTQVVMAAQVGGDMEGTRVQHISVGLHHVGALAATTQMRQLPKGAQVCHTWSPVCGRDI